MRQLSPLDAQLLEAESSTVFAHVGSLVTLDPATAPEGTLTVGNLRALIEQRLHLMSPLRWQLVEVPFGADYPYWIEAPDFDLDNHVFEVWLPAPGDERQLAEETARLAELALDRRRPLWEVYLIRGLSGGYQALYTKVHHALIDGISGAEILAVAMDTTPEPRQVGSPETPWQPEQAPSRLELLGRSAVSLATYPVRALQAGARALPHIRTLPAAADVPGSGLLAKLSGAGARLTGLGSGAGGSSAAPPTPPPTPFNAPITDRRHLAFGSLPLEQTKRVKQVFGLSVNDVVMTLCAAALRHWLVDRDALPEDPLVAAVPVSIRTPEQRGTGGNQISMMFAPLPTHLADPTDRLQVVHRAMTQAKRRFKAVPDSLVQDYSALIPGALSGLTQRALLQLVTPQAPPLNLFISNVPGPQTPLYVAGAHVRAVYPVSAISDVTGGLNITVLSHEGYLHVGIVTCPDVVPDAWAMIDDLRAALEELDGLAARTAPEIG